jgi:hypothetical protein
MVKFYQFFRKVSLQIHFGYGAARIRNYFFRIRTLGPTKKFRMRSDPDPQHWNKGRSNRNCKVDWSLKEAYGMTYYVALFMFNCFIVRKNLTKATL